jgi:glycogen debranching enzyme
MMSYNWTGDRARLGIVREPLIRYYEALKKYIRQGNGLYMTDWASQDNSPRNPFLKGGGTAIDTSSQMVLFARNLAEMSATLGFERDARIFISEAEELAGIINAKMWDFERCFYFDLTLDEDRAPMKTICAFWTLVAKVATPEKAQFLVAQLRNPGTFGRLHPVPSLAADEVDFLPEGGYWSGAVWTPTNLMIIKGLEQFGEDELAREIALKHLDAVAQVYEKTGTFWENYAADFIKQGINVHGEAVVNDMVGWGGLPPILYLLEYGIGLRPDAPENTLVWKLNSDKRAGCERFRFNGHVVDLLAEPSPGESIRITVQSDGEFLLKVSHRHYEQVQRITKGFNRFTV